MIRGAHSLVEDIRRDSESDFYYKYPYVRLDDGRFVQLGIDADLVQGFLSSFELQRIVSESGSFHLVDHVCFLGPDFTVLASSTPDHVSLHLDDTDLRGSRCWPGAATPKLTGRMAKNL